MSEKQGTDRTGNFHIGYDEHSHIFTAYKYVPDRKVCTPVEVSYSLEELMRKCKQNQDCVYFDGLNRAAIDLIYRWLTVDRPVLEYVEGLWGDSGPSKKGPLGFIPPSSKPNDSE